MQLEQEELESETSSEFQSTTDDLLASSKDFSKVSKNTVSFNESLLSEGAAAFQKPEISLLDDVSDTETLVGGSDSETEDGAHEVRHKSSGNSTVERSLGALEEDTMQGSIAGVGMTSLDTTIHMQQQLKVYQQYNFSYRDPVTVKLPVFTCKKEVAY